MGYWLPGLGLGVALVSWLTWRIFPALAVVLLLVRTATHADDGMGLVLVDSSLHILLIGLSWWHYFDIGRGSSWLDDPTSATLFLILVPGGLSAFAALAQETLWTVLKSDQGRTMMEAGTLWLSRMVGILAVAPVLIVVGTPILLRRGFVLLEQPRSFFGEHGGKLRGEQVELAGLTFATSVLALLLLWTRLHNPDATWLLWAVCLTVIVWTCIRQGLTGGCLSASVTSVLVLATAQQLTVAPEIQRAIQGNVLAFCSSALLIGVSTSWIRATETRFRHVVSRIPFVVYSARLPEGIPSIVDTESGVPKRDSKMYVHVGPSISKLATVMLVSPASQRVLGCEPETLVGPFTRWLDLIEPSDHVLVVAALAQLCLQKQPVTCEYRLRAPELPPDGKSPYPCRLAGPPGAAQGAATPWRRTIPTKGWWTAGKGSSRTLPINVPCPTI